MRRIVVAVLVLAALAVAVAGWRSLSRGPSAAAGQGGGPGAAPEPQYTQTDSRNGVFVTATLLGKGESEPGRLAFRLTLETHSGDITAYNPAAGAKLVTADGRTITEGFSWIPESENSHHRLGVLSLPEMDSEGHPYVGADSSSLKLILAGLKGGPAHSFAWGKLELAAWRETP
ncbi:hypothetical protein [Gelria sp. Kuro-4]|uniref:hypothetical protein n=1 Tax=Gelria sp. Kuro-4 TaxID=2796927 RepID=UPI001BF0BF48|nr:hypothetical protein [Gelria sp. Kuro-4]BCV24177.1 hypothetical protein kuro4_09500 [Gelria sp. Kuro-4]